MNTESWIDAVAQADIPLDDVIGLIIGGREVALYNVDGAIYATANACTHGKARLCDGFLDGHEIECPLHQGKFDVRDGRGTCEPIDTDVQTYPVRIENGRVFLSMRD